ncbi:hypothetical protein [Marispirochaeta aestuarii]|uniref:hypothetical protein n=1 Tax=Marispirochaeta aestuarii TaxID=1963862 RepID=UPI002ABE7B5D|nr:hypothetical protein [Marispirochaeta aestuarii]
MAKKLTSLIGLSKTDFDEFISSGDIKLRQARLIPVLKAGDEMALTSVFLSALRIVNEFRQMFFSDIKMVRGGQFLAFTEVTFPGFDDSRIDGLILIVKSGVIKDATIFEMKNEANELQEDQITKYVEISRKFSIPRLVTVSNQFVSDPSQFPLSIKVPKDVSLYHFSWTYILTIAHILLFNNDTNIEDEDQVEVMKEVVAYLENEKSGVSGFNQMKAGWKEIVERINSGTRIKMSDTDLEETVNSWQQEEKDMALILSKKLGVFVITGNNKFKTNLKARIDHDKKKVIDQKTLTSFFKVKGAVSDISVIALLEKRTIEMSVGITPPGDKTERGKIGWLNRQIESCMKKNADLFNKLKSETIIEVLIKNSSQTERYLLDNIDKIINDINGKEIREFRIVLLKDFGKSFSNRKKFVSIIEEMLIDFYSSFVQHLKNWEKPAPKIVERKGTENQVNYSGDVTMSAVDNIGKQTIDI